LACSARRSSSSFVCSTAFSDFSSSGDQLLLAGTLVGPPLNRASSAGGQHCRERGLGHGGAKEGQAAEIDVRAHKLAQGFALARGGIDRGQLRQAGQPLQVDANDIEAVRLVYSDEGPLSGKCPGGRLVSMIRRKESRKGSTCQARSMLNTSPGMEQPARPHHVRKGADRVGRRVERPGTVFHPAADLGTYLRILRESLGSNVPRSSSEEMDLPSENRFQSFRIGCKCLSSKGFGAERLVSLASL